MPKNLHLFGACTGLVRSEPVRSSRMRCRFDVRPLEVFAGLEQEASTQMEENSADEAGDRWRMSGCHSGRSVWPFGVC